MNEITYLKLQPGEVAVLDAASRIYSACLASNPSFGEERELLEKSIRTAIRMAEKVEDLVRTKDE